MTDDKLKDIRIQLAGLARDACTTSFDDSFCSVRNLQAIVNGNSYITSLARNSELYSAIEADEGCSDSITSIHTMNDLIAYCQQSGLTREDIKALSAASTPSSQFMTPESTT